MAKSRTPARPAQAGDNSSIAFVALVEDWHHLDRDDLFARGELLIKAHDIADGDWEAICKNEFEISHDKARHLMQVAKVAKVHDNFRGLRVRTSTLYKLAGIGLPIGVRFDHKNLPAIIEALAEAGNAAEKTLSLKAADDVIYFAPLRKKYGKDMPDATLVALNESVDNKTDWGRAAAKQLKKDRPATEEAADAIVNTHHRSHVARIFKVQVEALPAWLNKRMLTDMETVPAKLRKKLLKKLGTPVAEAAYNSISKVINEIEDEQAESEGDEEQGESKQDDKQDEGEQDESGKKADKPELVWEREGHGTRARTSGGYYEVNKLDYEQYATHFWPNNEAAVSLGAATSLKLAKGLAQAHYEKSSAPAPAPELTRAEILTADRWWAVQLADNEIENARKLYALLVDDERRIAVTETLGKAIDAKAIDAGKGHPIPEALIDVMAEALGVTDNDEDPTESADRLAATEDESEEWRIKYKKISWGLVLECHARQPQTKQRGHAAIRDAGRGGGRRARGDRA